MCLVTVTGTPTKTTGFGWKVFKKTTGGKIYPENRGSSVYRYNTWYEAESFAKKAGALFPLLMTEKPTNYPTYCTTRKEYANGFHVALRRFDARAFVKRHGGFIRQVEYKGAHTAGTGGSYFPGSQVFVAEIRILAPRPGGSAYAKKTKRSRVKPITNPTAFVEAAVAAE